MNVAVIPARGGSKRIPGKNIKAFAGKPIMAWVIEAARDSGLFERIIVSTDDPDIAAVAVEYDAEVPFVRPPALADDHTGILEVVQHAIEWLAQEDVPVDYVCCLLATAAFLRPDDLAIAFEKLVASDASYAFSVSSFPFPIQRAIRINGAGRVEALWPENIRARSQDLEEAYHDAGQFYWGTSDAFRRGEIIFSEHSIPVQIPRYRSQDIDTPEDWRLAELMFDGIKASGDLSS